jgi:iron complex transport system ATP-binding protein
VPVLERRMVDPLLALESVAVDRAGRRVIAPANLRLHRGEMLVLVGANGSGKSTLLDVMSGALRPSDGIVRLKGKAIGEWSRRERAASIAHLHQHLPDVPGLRVRDLVAHGRFPQRGLWSMLRGGADDVSRRAMEDTGTAAFADRFVDSLSGGERQRVRLALALAQDAPLLLLDEPTTFLDVCHQLEILALIHRLRQERQLTVVAVLHDLEHAARYGDRIAALLGGSIHRIGTPEETLDAALLAEVFSVEGQVVSEHTAEGPRLRVHIESPLGSPAPRTG